MKFEAYENIKNYDHKKTLDKFFYGGHLLDSVKWCVTEKVHGAHFDVVWDGFGEVEFWSRGGKLHEGSNFNNYLTIKDKLDLCIKDAYTIIERETGVNRFELIICGEIFGGTYPHKDVDAVMNVKRVQKGVFYSPAIEFYAYDIKVNGEFLNYYSAVSILYRAGFLVAQILKSGTFKECMEYSNKFQTQIPVWLKLPEIEDNICEGIVIKPIKPERTIFGDRVILKNRNEVYDERSKAPKIPREPKVLTERAQEVFNVISTYVTQQRLDSVMSKIDKTFLTKKQGFGTIMGAFRKDIMVSFNDDYEGYMNCLVKADKSDIARMIGKLCVPLVKEEFIQMLE